MQQMWNSCVHCAGDCILVQHCLIDATFSLLSSYKCLERTAFTVLHWSSYMDVQLQLCGDKVQDNTLGVSVLYDLQYDLLGLLIQHRVG